MAVTSVTALITGSIVDSSTPANNNTFYVEFDGNDGSYSSSISTNVNVTNSSNQIATDIMTAVATAVNTALGTALTAANILLINRPIVGGAAFQSGDIASGSIGSFHLADGAVASGDIAANAVASGQIASGQVGTVHISSGGLGSGAIGSGQIGSVHIASGTIIPSVEDEYITSEIISGVRCVRVTASGLLQIAMAAVSGRMPADGVAIINALSGGTLSFVRFGETTGVASEIGSGFCVSGRNGSRIWVGASGQVVTISGGGPTIGVGATNSGALGQIIGRTIGSGRMFVNADNTIRSGANTITTNLQFWPL